MHRGYVKLWRKSRESAVFQDAHLWHLWTYCLMSANHEEKHVIVDRLLKPVTVKRGQFVTGRYALHEGCYPKHKQTDPSPSSVWRHLELLRDMGNLNIETNSKFSMITICNFSTYNDHHSQDEQQNEQQVNSKRTASEQQVNTTKNDKELKRSIKGTAAFVKPTLVEVTAYCLQRKNEIDPEEFIAHYETNGWKVGKSQAPMRNWQAAVITWEKNAKRYGNQKTLLAPVESFAARDARKAAEARSKALAVGTTAPEGSP